MRAPLQPFRHRARARNRGPSSDIRRDNIRLIPIRHRARARDGPSADIKRDNIDKPNRSAIVLVRRSRAKYRHEVRLYPHAYRVRNFGSNASVRQLG